jgi:hypothetical protein
VRPDTRGPWKALPLARDIRQAAPVQPMILTVHEMKRLARNAAELMTLSATLQAAGIQLELLTGIYDPGAMGTMLFTVLGVAAQLDREYIREKTLRPRDREISRPGMEALGVDLKWVNAITLWAEWDVGGVARCRSGRGGSVSGRCGGRRPEARRPCG